MKTRLTLGLIMIGIALFVVGLELPQYSDKTEYEHSYLRLDGPSRSQDFYELRRVSLTPSLKLQDYGLTMISLGIVCGALFYREKVIPWLPRGKLSVALFGIFAAGVTMAAQIGSLFLDAHRGEFPHWADSLGIPLAGMSIIFILLAIWSALHSTLTRKRDGAIFLLNYRNLNWWRAFLVVATGLILALSAALGDFWQIIPAGLWITFYFSIWISRSDSELRVLRDSA